jgi:hypothetical protein
LVFRIFSENIVLAPRQPLPQSGKIPPPSPGGGSSGESLQSTEISISELQAGPSIAVFSNDAVASAKLENPPNVDNPPLPDSEAKALLALNQAIKDLVDLGLESEIIENQFRQAMSTLTQSIANSLYTKVDLQEGAELDQSVSETRQQILTESTRVITGHSNLKREGILDLLK